METITLQQLSVNDLKQLITDSIRAEIQALPNQKTEEYLTRRQTAGILQISLVTLNEWSKRGILQSYRIGGRIRYKHSEIEKAMRETKNLKYQRG